jgi:hypothetical protein
METLFKPSLQSRPTAAQANSLLSLEILNHFHFLPHKNYEIINVSCLKLLGFKVYLLHSNIHWYIQDSFKYLLNNYVVSKPDITFYLKSHTPMFHKNVDHFTHTFGVFHELSVFILFFDGTVICTQLPFWYFSLRWHHLLPERVQYLFSTLVSPYSLFATRNILVKCKFQTESPGLRLCFIFLLFHWEWLAFSIYTSKVLEILDYFFIFYLLFFHMSLQYFLEFIYLSFSLKFLISEVIISLPIVFLVDLCNSFCVASGYCFVTIMVSQVSSVC